MVLPTLASGSSGHRHTTAIDFLNGWIEGSYRLDTGGGLSLGGESSAPVTPLHLPTSVPRLTGPVTDSSGGLAAECVINAWPGAYRLASGSQGLPELRFSADRQQWFPAGNLPKAEIADIEWHQGSLLVLMRPKGSLATSTHLYELPVTPEGKVGGPKLCGLAPPGVILLHLSRIENRLFSAGRHAGENRIHLFEHRERSSSEAGWYDLGPCQEPEGSAWDLQSAGESLLLVSPERRFALVARAPDPGDGATWSSQRLGGLDWKDSLDLLKQDLLLERDRSALVLNRFRLEGSPKVRGLQLDSEGDSSPLVRFRIAPSPEGFFGDWSRYYQTQDIPVEEQAGVLEYQILQPSQSEPVRIRSVALDLEGEEKLQGPKTQLTALPGVGLPAQLEPSGRPGDDPSSQPSVYDRNRAPGSDPSQLALPKAYSSLRHPVSTEPLESPLAQQIPPKHATPQSGLDESPAPNPFLTEPRRDRSVASPAKRGTPPESSTAKVSSETNRSPSDEPPLTAEIGRPEKEPPQESQPSWRGSDPTSNGSMNRDSNGLRSAGANNAEGGISPPTSADPSAGESKDRQPAAANSPHGGSTSPAGTGGGFSSGGSSPAHNGAGHLSTFAGLDSGMDSDSLSNGSNPGNPSGFGEGSLSGHPNGGTGPLASTPPFGMNPDSSGRPHPGESSGLTSTQLGPSAGSDPSFQPSGAEGNQGSSGQPNGASPKGSSGQVGSGLAAGGDPSGAGQTTDGLGSSTGSRGGWGAFAPLAKAETSTAGDGSTKLSRGIPSDRKSERASAGTAADPGGRADRGFLDSLRSQEFASKWLQERTSKAFGKDRGISPLSWGSGSSNTGQAALSSEEPGDDSSNAPVKQTFTWGWLLLVLLAVLIAAAQASMPRARAAGFGLPPRLSRAAEKGVDWEQCLIVGNREENALAAQSLPTGSLNQAAALRSFPDLPKVAPAGRKIEWQVAEPLPQPLAPAAAFYHRGTVYAADPHGTLCAARVRADGSLCPWGVRMGRLPAGRWTGSLAVLDDHLVSQVDGKLYRAAITDRGIGEWKPLGEIQGLTGPVRMAGWKNRLFLVGGQGESGRSPLVRSLVLRTGGTTNGLQTHPPLPVGLFEHGLAAGPAGLYSVGGASGEGADSRVFVAPLGRNGEPQDWQTGPELPVAARRPVLEFWDGALWAVVSPAHSKNSQIYRAEATPEGCLRPWELVEDLLPERVEGGAMVYAGGRFLLLGGWQDRAGLPRSEVFSWAPA